VRRKWQRLEARWKYGLEQNRKANEPRAVSSVGLRALLVRPKPEYDPRTEVLKNVLPNHRGRVKWSYRLDARLHEIDAYHSSERPEHTCRYLNDGCELCRIARYSRITVPAEDAEMFSPVEGTR